MIDLPFFKERRLRLLGVTGRSKIMRDRLLVAIGVTRRHGFRHLPICHEQRLVGIVSLRDIILHDLDEKDDEVRMMRAYIHSA